MSRLRTRAGAFIATGIALVVSGSAGGAPPANSQAALVVNRGVVEMMISGAAGISANIAEDLANVVDDGATRRVVPVIGKGSLQNLTDLRLLRGIDVAILQADVLDYVKERGIYPGIEQSITFIAKLYNEEFHLLARRETKSITDLDGKTVNVDLRGSGTAVTASRVFDLLKLKVNLTYDSQEVALEKLRRGEIAALAFVAGKPAPLFARVTAEQGLQLLSIPFSSAVGAAYSPSRLTAGDYPGLVPADQPIDTIAVGAVLVAADLQFAPDRYRNVTNFVEAFFTDFQSLLTPGHHPKWREVNIAADLPGWRRYPPAEQWLQRNMQVAAVPSPDELRLMFARFVDERRQAAGGATMTPQEKEALFQQFQRWQSGVQR